MRALFTQLSLFTGLLTAFNAMEASFGLITVIFFGLSAGCAVYLALLVGDFAVHRFLEDKAPRLTSVELLQEALDSSVPVSVGDLDESGSRSSGDAIAA